MLPSYLCFTVVRGQLHRTLLRGGAGSAPVLMCAIQRPHLEPTHDSNPLQTPTHKCQFAFMLSLSPVLSTFDSHRLQILCFRPIYPSCRADLFVWDVNDHRCSPSRLDRSAAVPELVYCGNRSESWGVCQERSSGAS